jgi:hypothetical protein
MTDSTLNPSDLWIQTVNLVKDRVNHRSLWEAMEQAVGIAIEQDTFIVGLNPRFFNQAGHLNVSAHKNAIENAVKDLTGRPLKVRIIEGDTIDDWNYTKQRDARIAAMREATYQRKDREEAEAQSWDTLIEYVAREYSNTPLRQLPQSRARFLTRMLYVVSDAMDTLYSENPDEAVERHLARVIDRIANVTDTPATIVALELDRLRAWRQQSAETS